jgi:hypothetical protein
MKKHNEAQSHVAVLEVKFSKVDPSSIGISSTGKLYNKA